MEPSANVNREGLPTAQSRLALFETRSTISSTVVPGLGQASLYEEDKTQHALGDVRDHYQERLERLIEKIKGQPNWKELINQKNAEGNTPLHRTAMHCHLECTRLLVEAGADLKALNAKGETPLEVAIDCNHRDVSLFLTNPDLFVPASKAIPSIPKNSSPQRSMVGRVSMEISPLSSPLPSPALPLKPTSLTLDESIDTRYLIQPPALATSSRSLSRQAERSSLLPPISSQPIANQDLVEQALKEEEYQHPASKGFSPISAPETHRYSRAHYYNIVHRTSGEISLSEPSIPSQSSPSGSLESIRKGLRPKRSAGRVSIETPLLNSPLPSPSRPLKPDFLTLHESMATRDLIEPLALGMGRRSLVDQPRLGEPLPLISGQPVANQDSVGQTIKHEEWQKPVKRGSSRIVGSETLHHRGLYPNIFHRTSDEISLRGPSRLADRSPSRDLDGKTSLHQAVIQGDSSLAYRLVESDADPSDLTHEQQNCYHFCAQYGHLELLKGLIQRTQARPGFKEALRQADSDGKTPLHLAVWGDPKPALVALLLDQGIDPNVQTTGRDPATGAPFNYTPLHWAAKHGHLESARILLVKGANPSLKNINDDAPMDLALRWGQDDLVRLFIDPSHVFENEAGSSSTEDAEGYHYQEFEKAYEDFDNFKQIFHLEKMADLFLLKNNYVHATHLLNAAYVLAKESHYGVQSLILSKLERIEALFIHDQLGTKVPFNERGHVMKHRAEVVGLGWTGFKKSNLVVYPSFRSPSNHAE